MDDFGGRPGGFGDIVKVSFPPPPTQTMKLVDNKMTFVTTYPPASAPLISRYWVFLKDPNGKPLKAEYDSLDLARNMAKAWAQKFPAGSDYPINSIDDLANATVDYGVDELLKSQPTAHPTQADIDAFKVKLKGTIIDNYTNPKNKTTLEYLGPIFPKPVVTPAPKPVVVLKPAVVTQVPAVKAVVTVNWLDQLIADIKKALGVK